SGGVSSTDSYTVGDQPISVAVADMDGDGNLDLAVANFGDDMVSVFRGDGAGALESVTTYAVGHETDYGALANFDGHIDIVTANYGDNSISFLAGNGDGTFQSREDFAVGQLPTSIAVADMDGDALPDIAVPNYGDDSVTVLINSIPEPSSVGLLMFGSLLLVRRTRKFIS